MNKFIVLITIMTFNSCIAQDNSIYYETAYSYLRALSEFKASGIEVSDTTTHIELSSFYKELSKGNEEAKLFELDSLDKKRSVKKEALNILQDLPDDKTAHYTLFFSEIIDNMILAEIIVNKGRNASYEQLTAFNNTTVFLFIFNKEKEIENVYRKEIQYD